jgi:hypothetical protein
VTRSEVSLEKGTKEVREVSFRKEHKILQLNEYKGRIGKASLCPGIRMCLHATSERSPERTARDWRKGRN